jgi:hypothetical protein
MHPKKHLTGGPFLEHIVSLALKGVWGKTSDFYVFFHFVLLGTETREWCVPV